MSQRLFINAVRDHLRLPLGAGLAADGLALTALQCEATLEGEPLPMAGELFVGVHEGPWRCTQEEKARNDSIGVYVTITRRVSFAPKDRRRIPLLDAADALDVWADKIASKIHGNLEIMGEANAALVTAFGAVNGFIRPLYFKGAQGPSQPKGPDWFSADGTDGADTAIGIARTLLFLSDETRYQTMESQT